MSRLLPHSIRRRTLLLVLMLLISMSSAIAVFSFHDASHEIEEIFDARLAQSARILQALVIGIYEANLHADEERYLQKAFEEALQAEASSSTVGHKYESKIAYQVWHGERLLMHSSNSPVTRMASLPPGFGTLAYDEHRWITFTLKTHASHFPFEVMVAEREDVRGELVDRVVRQTLIPELIGIPLLALLMWWAVGWGLSPLQELVRQIRTMAPDSLKPIRLASPVRELVPVEQALNRLLADTDVRIAREQRLIADAAHELRTPLAVLRIHADNALQASDDNDRREALQHLRVGVERSTRVLSQLLTLARLDPEAAQQRQPLNLLQESRQQLADLMPLAWSKHIELSLDADEQQDWTGSLEEGALEILLQNLISNAVKFSPEHSQIDISWQRSNGYFILQVADHGCGVSREHLPHLTERFYRQGQQAGAGLGLSIVQRITERHQGRIRLLDTDGGGLTVRIELPVVARP